MIRFARRYGSRIRPEPSFAAFLLVLAVLLPRVTGGDVPVVRIDIPADRLPYRAVIADSDKNPYYIDHEWSSSRRSFALGDSGAVFEAYAVRAGIVLDRYVGGENRSLWQFNLPVPFCWRPVSGMIDGAWDVDGDGDREILVTSCTEDRRHWRIWALDAVEGRPVAIADLRGGPDRRPDGVWDGRFMVVDVQSVPTPRGEKTALILGVDAGFDIEPRGLMAVDPFGGEVLWRLLAGPPAQNAQFGAVDLDGDGAREILWTGNAVHNMGQEKLGGWSDDVGALFVADRTGRMRWARVLIRDKGSSWPAVADLDGDGRPEVIVGTAAHTAAINDLAVFEGADGREMARFRVGGKICGVGALSAVADRPGRIYAVTQAGRVMAWEWTDAGLRLVREAHGSEKSVLVAVADILPEPGCELVIWEQRSRARVLGADLRPLGVFTSPDLVLEISQDCIMAEEDGPPSILCLNRNNGTTLMLRFIPAPDGSPWMLYALAPLLGAAGAAVALARRRRRRSSPATLRDLRLQLLGRLELSGHKAIGSLKPLRRALWLLSAMASEAGEAATCRERFEAICGVFETETVSELRATAELCAIAGLDRECERPVRTLDRLRSRIGKLVRGGCVPAEMRESLTGIRRDAERLEADLQDLRRTVAGFFRCDVAAVARAVLADWAETCAEAGVSAEVRVEGGPPVARCDPGEMEFILDNLVGNAVRAMAGAEERRLSLTFGADSGMVLGEVADTGCGIVPDDWESVMESRASDRDGGGMGLPRSRSLLRKYEGRLYIRSSELGRGTVIGLEIPAAGN